MLMTSHNSQETAQTKIFPFGDNTIGKHLNGLRVKAILERARTETIEEYMERRVKYHA